MPAVGLFIVYRPNVVWKSFEYFVMNQIDTETFNFSDEFDPWTSQLNFRLSTRSFQILQNNS